MHLSGPDARGAHGTVARLYVRVENLADD